MRHFLTTISLFSAVLFSVGILSSSGLAQNPRPTPTPVYRPSATPPVSQTTPGGQTLDMDTYLAKIQQQRNSGQTSAAIATATECISAFPSSVTCYKLRGQLNLTIYLEKPVDVGNLKLGGKQDQEPEWLVAVADLTKAISISPQFADLYYQRGLIYIQGYNTEPFELAIADAKKALELKPTHQGARSLLEKATGGYARGLSKEAVEKYVRAANLRVRNQNVEADKELNEAIAIMARVLPISPSYSVAGDYLSRARMYRDLKKYDLAIADFSKGIELRPNCGDCYIEKAEVYRIQKKYDLVFADYDKLLSRPDETDTTFAKQRIPIGRADTYREMGRYDMAIAEYSKIIAADPKRQDVQWGLALAYHYKGDKIAAEAEFQKALAISWNPKALREDIAKLGVVLGGTSAQGTSGSTTNAQADFNAGIAFKNQGNHAAAKIEFTRAITKNPRDASSYYQRAFSNYSLKLYDEAIQDYSQSIALDPSNKFAFNERGNTYFKLDNFELAVADFSKALAMDPRNTDFLNNRGYANLRLGRIDLSLADYGQSIAIDPNKVEPWVARGNINYSLNKFDAAASDYSRAIVLAPKRTDNLINRAHVYKELKETTLAIADVDAALAIEPGNRFALELKRALGSTTAPTVSGTPSPQPVDTESILGLWEGTGTLDKTVATNSFKFSRVNGALSAVLLGDETRTLASTDISLSPDGTIVIKYIVDSATNSTITFSGKVDPAANKMGGTVVLQGNNQRLTGTWQAVRKPVTNTVSDEARFKQIILDIAVGKSVPEADKTWADNYEKQKRAAKASAKVAETVDQKKARAWPLFQQALADYNASNFVGAINGFTEYLKILPDAIDARLNRGFAHNKLGQSELALADFEYVLKIKPDEPYALEEAAKTRAKLPRKVETLSSIFQVTDMKVTDAGYRELQSLIERYAIAGLTSNRKFEPYLTLTIDAYEMLTANGLKTLRQMAPAADISDARFAELFGLNCPKPKVTAGTLNSGEVVNALKCTFGPSTMKAISPDKRIDRSSFAVLLNQALSHGTEKLKLNSKLEDPKTGPITKATAASAKELVDRGLELIGKKDYMGASRLFTQAIEYDPNYIEAYRFRGISALMLYEQNPPMQGQMLYTAQFNFDHAINRGSTYPDDFYMRGMTHEKLGHKNEAIADYRKALSIDPNLQKAKDALKRLGATP